MTAQAKTLVAPDLKEAVNGVLHVSQLKGDAHGDVPPYPLAAAGDEITMQAETSTGNEWKGSHVLTAAEVGKHVIFAIPKSVFEKNLVPGANANLRYIITQNGNSLMSPSLTIRLER